MRNNIEEKLVLNAITRTDLSYFIQHMFHHFDGSQEFIKAPYIDILANRLTQCYEGKIKRLIINIPPRSLKSFSTSIAFPAWVLGHKPNSKIVCVSYSQDLADKHGRDTLKIMESDLYKEIFKTRINPNKCSGNDFETTEHGYRIATSIGGTLTGRGGDIIIIDDPIKPEDAFNLTSRENLMDWYRSTLYSRLNNQNNGVIIVVMQRLHVDDLTGQLLKQEGWELLKFPLIAEQDEIYILNNSFFERKNGELLNSKMWSEESVNKLRQTISDYHFQAQYQQNPVLPDGNIIKFEWLKYYPIEKLSYSPHCIFQSWDIAGTISEKSDYSVCITCAYFGDYIYILDVYRDKLEYVDLKNKVIAKQKEYSCLPENIVIENKNIGHALINDLKNNTNMSVSTCNPVDSKELRLLFQSPKIKNGELWIPEKSQWKKDFVDEVTSFPKSQHDDQVDALSQLLWFLESKKIYFKPQKDIPKVPTIEDFIINPKEFFRGIKYHGHYRKK